MSSGDPDLDAVLDEAKQQASSGDPDLDAVVQEASAPPKSSLHPGEMDLKGARVTDTRGGVLDVATDRLIGGPIRALAGGLTGVVKGEARGLQELFAGKGFKKAQEAGTETAANTINEATSSSVAPKTETARSAETVLGSSYNPMNWPDKSGEWLAEKSADLGAPAGVSAGLRAAPDVAAMLLGGKIGGRIKGKGAVEEVAAPPHPLAGAAEAETARLAQMRAQGTQAGLALRDGGTPAQVAADAVQNQPVSNAMTRQELGLPPQAPMTPEMLDAARTHYGSPPYQAVSKVPEFKLGPKYESSISDVDLSEIKPKYRPPENGAMTGERAVELSRYLRNKANKYFAAAKGNPELEDTAQAHWDAAEAVEDAVRDHLKSVGKEQMADDWDNARTYIAKTYSVQNALDGAGNIRVTELKRQLLKNKPLSGNLETLANLGAQYPQAFRLTPQSMPQVGLMRRATAAGIAHASTASGAALGSIFGPLGTGAGAIGGRALGQHWAEKIIPP